MGFRPGGGTFVPTGGDRSRLPVSASGEPPGARHLQFTDRSLPQGSWTAGIRTRRGPHVRVIQPGRAALRGSGPIRPGSGARSTLEAVPSVVLPAVDAVERLEGKVVEMNL